MLSARSIDAVSANTIQVGEGGRNRFVRPIYSDYGFAQIPNTIRSLFGLETRGAGSGVPFVGNEDLHGRYDAVVLFFIDAFGWRFFDRFSDHPFLQRMIREGLVQKITSQFPSTTAAHVTAIHTGENVGESGVYEWFYYEPVVDALIAPLLYSYAGDEERGTLLKDGVRPELLFPSRTLYQELAEKGVRSHVIQDYRYTDSPYTRVVTNGAKLVPYRTLPEAIASLYECLQRQHEPTYYFLYYDKIDSICHQHGPNSIQLEAEIIVFLDTMESLFHTNISKYGGKLLFLMTADHAQVEIDPATTFYLNLSLPQLTSLLRRNHAGKILAPAGSTRDVFLHVTAGALDEAIGLLRHALAGKAQICASSELLAQGYFAGPSENLLKRIGDLVILPYAHESVWWYEKGRFEQKHYGSHGGLTAQEMETIFLAQRYGK